MSLPTVRVAAAHISPHLLSARLSTQKTVEHISLAAKHGANLVCFPESSIPGFPIWSSLLPPSHPSTHDFFRRFAEESVSVTGSHVAAVKNAASKHKICVSLGISEKADRSVATLWNTNLLINENGRTTVHHRKLACTWFEKLSWSHGDGHGLRTMQSDSGVRIGALICGENTNPLARYAVMATGEHIHVSTWPSIWPSRMPMNDESKAKGKNYDNVLANRIRASSHCFEAKCFGIMSAAHFSQENLDTLLSILDPEDQPKREIFEFALQHTSRAASMILDPTGTPVKAWTVTKAGEKKEVEMLQHEEGLLFADIDLNECVEGKQYHDILGSYQRFDVFSLQVNRTRHNPITLTSLDDHEEEVSK